jgi:flagellar motor switch protein FliN/FliY
MSMSANSKEAMSDTENTSGVRSQERSASMSADIPPEVRQALEALKPFRGIPLDLTIELGKGKLKLRDLLGLKYHSIFDLDKSAGGKLDIYINGVLLGNGEPIAVGDRMGIKINEIVEHER